jgi:hypothetical protein
MTKKQNKKIQAHPPVDDPKQSRRAADALEGTERIENVRRIQTAQYRAQINPRTGRPKR